MLTHKGSCKIRTERMILRKFEYTDDNTMLKHWISDEKVQHLYCEPVYTSKQEVKELLDKFIGGYANDNYYRWAIVLKETNECIGQIAFFLVDSKNKFAEIEYCIGREFHRKGLMTEAVKKVIEFGFDEMKLHKVQICHMPSNIQSKGVIEKCSFVYEGALRDYFYLDGKYEDRLYYSILRDEYYKLGRV